MIFAEDGMEKKKRYLLYWAVVCLLVFIIGAAIPRSEMRSLGLEGANQANLKNATEELTEGKTLTFTVAPPEKTTDQIGFFVTLNGHEFKDGMLRIIASDGEKVIGGRDFPLADLNRDQFLFVKLEEVPEILTVRIASDSRKDGPSIWLNETTVTPGEAVMDGEILSQSLVYNLTYTVQVHRFAQPLILALILLLFGMAVYSAGGFVKAQKRKNELPRLQQGITMRRTVGLGIAVVLCALLFFYLYDTRIRIAQNTTEKVTIYQPDGDSLEITKNTAELKQLVRPEQDRLTGFGIRFWITDGAVLSGGSMHARVTDLTLGEILCETDIPAEQFISGEYVGLLFENSQTGVKDHEYEIDLTFSRELWNSGLEVMTSHRNLCVNAYLYFNIFLKKFFFFMFLGVEGLICLFWYLAFVRKVRVETLFLVTVLGLGLFYNVLITPQMVPDEAKHIDMAYRYSNELLGYESLGDTTCLMRADDAAMEFTSSPSFKNYRNIYYGLFSRVQDDRMVEADINSNIEGSILFYAPAVLGMTLARLLHLGTVPMLLLARYLNLAVFALLTWLGMRRLPFGKTTLFLISVLPVNLQQCTSFSHDAMVHGILFLYGSLCLEAIYVKEKLTGQKMLLLAVLGVAAVYCKSGSYLPMVLLTLLIPAAAYGSRQMKLFGTCSLFGTVLLTFLMKNAAVVRGITGTTEATSVVTSVAGSGSGDAVYATGYTLGYFLHDPLQLIYMIVNTILDKGGFYMESLIGYKLGWVEIETSEMLVVLFLFLLFLSILTTREEAVWINSVQRGIMIISCLGCAGFIVLGMLLSWTPVGHVSVEGVQGRYFLPFLLILLTACRNNGIYLRTKMDRMIITAALSGQLLTIVYVIKQVMAV